MREACSHFSPEYLQLLLELLVLDTTSPMETGKGSSISAAQRRFQEFAVGRGFASAYFAAPAATVLTGADVPISVHEMAARLGDEFLSSQPNLVLRAGSRQPTSRTLMFNVHMDTVAGHVPVGCQNGVVTGRGAIDAKGPAVALLAGIEAALHREPQLRNEIQILLQSVAGEEGGAMGIYGTRPLVEMGFVGRLNVFAEPSEEFWFDHSTTSMTARISVHGRGATDDTPEAGENATVILTHLAQYLVRHLVADVRRIGGKLCIAGLHTGTMHNRVYGEGTLHLNLAYDSMVQATALEAAVESRFAEAMATLAGELAAEPTLAATSRAGQRITQLVWLKRRLPILGNRDAAMEDVLAKAGLHRLPPERNRRAFTCDAMWAQGPSRYTVVYGPCSLEHNHAHADDEFITLTDLERYTREIAAIVSAFGSACRAERNAQPLAEAS